MLRFRPFSWLNGVNGLSPVGPFRGVSSARTELPSPKLSLARYSTHPSLVRGIQVFKGCSVAEATGTSEVVMARVFAIAFAVLVVGGELSSFPPTGRSGHESVVLVRQSAGQRWHGRSQYWESGTQAGGGVCCGAVPIGRSRTRRWRCERLHPNRRFQDATHRRGAVESRFGQERQDGAVDAGGRCQHQHARRSCFISRRSLVFVGYGLNIPEKNINDFGGVNLKGAVVVYIASTPKSLPGPLQAHFGSAAERWKMYKSAGAIGTISIANPKSTDIPWARSTLARLQPAMSLADPSLEDAPGQRIAITMNPAHADKLFAGTSHTFQDLLALVDAGSAVPALVLPAPTQSNREGRACESGIAECRRGPARIPSRSAQRIRSTVGSPRSSWCWRAHQSRHDL